MARVCYAAVESGWWGRFDDRVVSASTNPDEAQKFVAYVTLPAGQATLARFGFAKP